MIESSIENEFGATVGVSGTLDFASVFESGVVGAAVGEVDAGAGGEATFGATDDGAAAAPVTPAAAAAVGGGVVARPNPVVDSTERRKSE